MIQKRQLPGFMQNGIAAIEAATAAINEENSSNDTGHETPQPRSTPASIKAILAHLNVIYLYAQYKGDVRGMELTKQLARHLKNQAAAGAYAE